MEEYQENPLVKQSEESEPKNEEKTPQKNFVAWIIIGGALLLGCVFGTVMLLRGIDNASEKIADDGKIESSRHESSKPADKPVEDAPKTDEVHYLGDDTNGYVKVVGGDWEKLNREWSKGVQYYSGMYVLLIAALNSDVGTAKDYAQSLYDIAVPTLRAENITLEKIDFKDYEDAYKLVMKDENSGSWNVEWIFKAEDDKIHYILIQGTDLESDKFKIAETFTLSVPEED